MGDEFKKNPEKIIFDGNIIGSELANLNNLSKFETYKCEISPSTTILNGTIVNSLIIKPIADILLTLYAKDFKNYINSHYDSENIILDDDSFEGEALSKSFSIYLRDDFQTINLLPFEVTTPFKKPSSLSTNTNVNILDKSYVFDEEGSINFYDGQGGATFIPIEENHLYTFSFDYYNKNNSSVTYKIRWYDTNYQLIDIVEGDKVYATLSTTIFLTTHSPSLACFALLEIINNQESEIKNITLKSEINNNVINIDRGDISEKEFFTINSSQIYTFSFKTFNKNNGSSKGLIRWYDSSLEVIKTSIGGTISGLSPVTNFITDESPEESVYVSFEIIASEGTEISELMFNYGNFEDYVSGFISENIENPIFTNYKLIKINEHVIKTNGASILYDVYNNGILVLENKQCPILLSTNILGKVEIKAKLSRPIIDSMICLEKLTIEGLNHSIFSPDL